MDDNNPDGGLSDNVLVMDEKLRRVRDHMGSKLSNQKNLALVLSAVEENLEEQKKDKSPVAYFVSFLSLLDQSIKDEQIINHDMITAAAYFLDLILPFTPKGLLKMRFGDILTNLAPPLMNPDSDAPLIRSIIGALESLLLAQDHQQWQSSASISPNRALVGLLELSTDARPKVRRRAQEAIRTVLSNPPASPSPIHVSAPICCDIALKKLITVMENSSKSKRKKDNENSAELIHSLQLITSITSANAWPANKVEALCDMLLEVSKTSNQFLVNAVFLAFEGLFSSMKDIIDLEKFTKVLDALIDLRPSTSDTFLAGSWLAIIAKAIEAFSALSLEACLDKLFDYFTIISQYLGSDSSDIYSSAAHCLIAIVTEAIPDNLLLRPSSSNGIDLNIYEKMEKFVIFVASTIENELFSIKYQQATKYILELVTAIVLKFRNRCNPEFLGILEVVGQWRTSELETFPYNAEVEALISAFISVVGPEVVLSVLPLNLRGEGEGRAWLLPLLRDNVRFASLEFYKKEILPLVNFFEDKISNSVQKESMHAKVFQTIIDQIWSLLPHFCDFPRDLQVAFDDEFASSLSDILYSKVELRTVICHGLRLLVQSNIAYSEGALSDDLILLQDIPIEEAANNVTYISTKANNVLSVLFNVFSSTVPESRGYILETIDVYLQIIPKAELASTFNKVCSLLRTALESEHENARTSDSNRLSATMMDLIVAMSKYLPESCHNPLFAIFASTVNLQKDGLLQKRSYRIISKLSESEEGKASVTKFSSEIEKAILSASEQTHNSARASRLSAIKILLATLPETDLHFIPSILLEIIISTKDINEKARQLSFLILIDMGRIMEKGGLIDNSKIPGFEESPPTEASISEYFTMLSAGLASLSPHMISATILALSCSVFEFKDIIPRDVLLEISSTVELFLTHNSREIAKAAIGFVKVEVLALPEDIVVPNLSEMLEKLMRWSHEHKEHFRSKVKHILERLIKKYGLELIEESMPKEDLKLINNIRKTQDRQKRKLEVEKAPQPVEARRHVSAFDDILYESEDEEQITDTGSKKGRNEQFIFESSDNPLNLLDRQTLAQISSSKPKSFSRKGLSSKSNFETQDSKLVFEENEEADPVAQNGSGIDAYLDAVKQAPVRGQRNKLKYKKSKAEDDWSDSDEELESKYVSKNKTLQKSKIRKPKHKSKFKAKKKF